MGLIDKASEIQSRIDTTFSQAYASLQIANITLGIIGGIAETVPVDQSVSIRYRSVMGVELPYVLKTMSPSRWNTGCSTRLRAGTMPTGNFTRSKSLRTGLPK
jgi:V/A-type H+-transporting ATPase subunit D